MSKMSWFKKILVFLRLAAAVVEDGTIGSGKKTAKGGKIAGDIFDEAGKIINAEDSEKTP